MFTPEFVSEKRDEIVLVSNHHLRSSEAIGLSVEYNRARIVFGREHLSASFCKCRVIYDIRGQLVADETTELIRQGLHDLASVEFMR